MMIHSDINICLTAHVQPHATDVAPTQTVQKPDKQNQQQCLKSELKRLAAHPLIFSMELRL